MIRRVGPVLIALSALAGSATAQSVFGCSDLDAQHALPVVEGLGGVFFRIDPDLRNFFELSDESVARIGELSDTLAENGTRLIYLPVPTKALAMPGSLPDKASDYGFDTDLATTVFADLLRRLEERGIAAADVRRPMVAAQGDGPTHFAADHRWTPDGARIAARAVAARIGALPDLAALPRDQFTTTPEGTQVVDSVMRAQIQQHCLLTLPPIETPHFTTTRVGGASGAAQIAVVGTEFTGDPASNFAGFLARDTGLDVVRYAVPDGGAYAAISAYLTSGAFQAARPAILVWEVPVWVNPATRGDQPMRELVAAAGNSCRIPLNHYVTARPERMGVDLSTLDPALDHTLMLDTGGTASRDVEFVFRARNGQSRTRTIRRHPGQAPGSVFAMPMSGLWPEGAAAVEIAIAEPFGPAPRVTACFHVAKG